VVVPRRRGLQQAVTRQVATSIGAVALSREEQDAFLAAVRADEGFRAAVRREVLSAQLLELPERVAEMDLRLTERLDRLAERLDRLTERVAEMDLRLTERLDRLAERLDRLTERVAEMDLRLTERLDRLTERLDQLTAIVARHQDDLGQLEGFDLERRVSQRPGGYLTPVLRKATAIPEPELMDLLSDDAEDVLRADVVARGRLAVDGEPTLAVVEVSWRAHGDDLDRALARAQLLARATGQRVLPMTVSQEDPGEAVTSKAGALGVALLLASTSPALVDGTPLRAA
jgi:predicted transcriptional regulator